MLIKNLIENRKGGWEKSKKANETAPMKVEDLRQQIITKMQQDETLRMQAEMEE